MTLATAPLYNMMNHKMNWLTQRQRVIAQNIANADTPNYKAQDLRGLDFKAELNRSNFKVRLQTTNAVHISSPQDYNYTYRKERSRRAYETAPMKNNVVIEEQMMKMTSTQADYQLATAVYRQYNQLYKISLGKGGG